MPIRAARAAEVAATLRSMASIATEEFGLRRSHIEDADDLSGCVPDRIVGGEIGHTEDVGLAFDSVRPASGLLRRRGLERASFRPRASRPPFFTLVVMRRSPRKIVAVPPTISLMRSTGSSSPFSSQPSSHIRGPSALNVCPNVPSTCQATRMFDSCRSWISRSAWAEFSCRTTM